MPEEMPEWAKALVASVNNLQSAFADCKKEIGIKVDRLESKVDRLESKVDRLGSELSELRSELRNHAKMTAAEFKRTQALIRSTMLQNTRQEKMHISSNRKRRTSSKRLAVSTRVDGGRRHVRSPKGRKMRKKAVVVTRRKKQRKA